jgi:putative ABC transport system permease protein
MKIRRALSLTLPRRFLRGGHGRLALALIALTCGVAFVCAVALVSRAVVGAFVEVIDAVAGRAALTVVAGGAPFPETTAAQVAQVPGVELAVPVVSATAITVDGSGEVLMVHGLDLTDRAAVGVYEAQDTEGPDVEDPLVFVNQPDSIIITQTWASRHGLRPNDHLDLMTPKGQRRFTVRGILEPQGIGRAYGGNLIVMDIAAAEEAFTQRELVNRVDVVVARNARLSDVAAGIAQRLPPGVHVESPSQRKADLQRVMSSLAIMVDAVSLIGLAAAFLIILNRLTTVFETRAWQLGILRGVGMRVGVLWWELVKESLVLGTIGVVLGVPIGIAAGRILLPVVATSAALNFKLIATKANLTIGAGPILTAIVLGLGTAVLAAALPAWYVAARSPVDTIRRRGIAVARRQGGGWRLRAAAGIAIVIAVALQQATHMASWGLAATGLIILGAVLAARPLVTIGSPLLLGGLRAIAGPSAHFARGSLARNSGRAVLTVALIGVGIGAIIWLRMLAYSFETSLVHALSGALQGDWVVTSAHLMHGYVEAPVDERLATEITSIEGVQAAVGERLVDWEYADGPIAIDAFDARYFQTTAFGRWPLVGAAQPDLWAAVSTGTAVLVSSSFAVNLGVQVGQFLNLETPRGPLKVAIGGVTVNFSSPRGTIIMARELYRAYWNDAQVNRVFVRAAAGTDLGALRGEILRRLAPSYGLRIVAAQDLIDYFAEQVRRAFAPVNVLTGLLLFVLLVGLADTLAASVLERQRDLAIIRTIGARGAFLRRAIAVEAMGLALPGLLLAVVVGFGLGTMWVRQTFPSLLGWALETHVPYAQVTLICATTLAVCWLAGLLPAHQAATLEPAAALRSE